MPKKEQRRVTTLHEERAKRAERRARTGAVDHALQLAGLWYRDLACVAAGAPDLAHHADRADELRADAASRSPEALREGVVDLETVFYPGALCAIAMLAWTRRPGG